MKLNQGLDFLFAVTNFELNLRYGRPFTPALLMRDSGACDPLTSAPLGAGAFETIPRRDALHHAGLGAKPFAPATIPTHALKLKIAITPWGIGIPALLAALAVMGAFSLAQTIAGLFALVTLAATLGPAGVAVGLAAGVALAITIAVAVPPLNGSGEACAAVMREANRGAAAVDVMQVPGSPVLQRPIDMAACQLIISGL